MGAGNNFDAPLAGNHGLFDVVHLEVDTRHAHTSKLTSLSDFSTLKLASQYLQLASTVELTRERHFYLQIARYTNVFVAQNVLPKALNRAAMLTGTICQVRIRCH